MTYSKGDPYLQWTVFLLKNGQDFFSVGQLIEIDFDDLSIDGPIS